MLHALSDPVRLRIVAELAKGGRRVHLRELRAPGHEVHVHPSLQGAARGRPDPAAPAGHDPPEPAAPRRPGDALPRAAGHDPRRRRRLPPRRAQPPDHPLTAAPVIARYTRPELAELWSDHARFEAMREVEVAACEEMEGPTPRSSRRSARPPSRSRRSTSARRSPTTTSPRSSTCCRSRPAPPGRWIHYGLTSSDVLDTGLALQIRARRRARAARRPRSWSQALADAARASTSTRCASGARTESTPSRRRSGSSWPASPSRPIATRSGWSARSRRRRSARSAARSAPTRPPPRSSSSAC